MSFRLVFLILPFLFAGLPLKANPSAEQSKAAKVQVVLVPFDVEKDLQLIRTTELLLELQKTGKIVGWNLRRYPVLKAPLETERPIQREEIREWKIALRIGTT